MVTENQPPTKKPARETPALNAALLERLGALETQVCGLQHKGIVTAALDSLPDGEQAPPAPSLLQRVAQLEIEMAGIGRRLERQRNHDGRCRALLIQFEDRLRIVEGEPGLLRNSLSLDLMDDYDLDEEDEPEQGAGAMLLEGSGYGGL